MSDLRVNELRLALAATVEEATRVAGHYSDWQRLGVHPHMPPEMTLARLDALTDALWDLAEAALDARMATTGVRMAVERPRHLRAA